MDLNDITDNYCRRAAPDRVVARQKLKQEIANQAFRVDC